MQISPLYKEIETEYAIGITWLLLSYKLASRYSIPASQSVISSTIIRAMAMKSLFFVLLLVASMAAPLAEAQLGLISALLGLIRIQGTVFCTANGNMGVNGTATPVFPNALVQLQCGAGNVVSTATTNGSGIFSIVLDPLQFLLSSLLTNCNLVVNTPLSNCNANLPAVGGLLSPSQFIGNTLLGLLNVANIIPAGFRFFS